MTRVSPTPSVNVVDFFGILHRREIRSKRKSGVVSKISFGLSWFDYSQKRIVIVQYKMYQ